MFSLTEISAARTTRGTFVFEQMFDVLMAALVYLIVSTVPKGGY